MNVKRNTQTRTNTSLRGLMADMAKYGVVFDQEGILPGEATEEEVVEEEVVVEPPKKEKKPAPKKEVVTPANTDAEALKAELAKAQETLAKYGDVKPDDLASLLELKASKEAAEAEAERTRQENERASLEAKGEWERLKAMMADSHKVEMEAVKAQVTEAQKQLASLKGALEEATVGSAFAGSKFISEDTVFTPNKARRLYGDHFDVNEKGQVVGYDAPRGSDKRTPLVDSSGKPLNFEDSIKRLVEADPEKESLLRDKRPVGSGLRPSTVKEQPKKAQELRGLDRIRNALNKNT